MSFNIETMNYRIKDLGIGYGVFYKLEKPLVILLVIITLIEIKR